MAEFGCHSMAGPLKRVLMRKPGTSYLKADADEWHYNRTHFNPQKAISEYQGFQQLIVESGAEITWFDDQGDGLCDAMFTRDGSMVTREGAVLFRMGKDLRLKEPAEHGRIFEKLGIPVIGSLEGNACIEGGDMIWLDQKTIAVGMGFRSNREGVKQLNALLGPQGIEVLGFDLPVWNGEAACLHLMSVISPLTETTYLVHPKLIPAALWSEMKARGIKLIVAPEEEFHASLGLNLNVLPLSPGNCIMISGFDGTKRVMEEAGIKVTTFDGNALCMACEGGPTCLTNPILRG